MPLDHGESWSVSVRNCHSQQLTRVRLLRCLFILHWSWGVVTLFPYNVI